MARAGRLRTKSADRRVPIQGAILEPLLDHVATVAPGANLWGLTPNNAGTYSAALSKRLNIRLDNAVPENEKLVTYSLRHTFATRLKHAFAADTLVDELMGHKVQGLAQGRYGKRFEVAKLKEAVELLRVDIKRRTLLAKTSPEHLFRRYVQCLRDLDQLHNTDVTLPALDHTNYRVRPFEPSG